jgi:hypothetical protein
LTGPEKNKNESYSGPENGEIKHSRASRLLARVAILTTEISVTTLAATGLQELLLHDSLPIPATAAGAAVIFTSIHAAIDKQ